jgi:DNA-binding NtrC family response regulator
MYRRNWRHWVGDMALAANDTVLDDGLSQAQRVPIILVVDDDALIRLMLSDFLQECGFKVFEAASALEAVDILKSPHVAIDVVVSDVRLPGGMSGFELAKWMREHCPKTVILLCSGDAKKSEVVHELCDETPFFSKPYDLNVILAQIRQSLKKSSPEN